MHYVLSAHAHNLAPYVGKGHQQAARIIELSDRSTIVISDAAARAGYVLYRALVVHNDYVSAKIYILLWK